MPSQRPTRRQLDVLRAYITAGSVAQAAHSLGLTESTVRQHLSGLYQRTGCRNAAQAGYLLGSGAFQSGVGNNDGPIPAPHIRPLVCLPSVR
jgi:DNA-binding NarL/FixJ family response regulator